MIVIGDVHGSYKTLMALMDKLPANVPVCFVGDLVDRGPRSREVVSFVKHSSHYCVRGNHEQMMIEHVRSNADDAYKNNWSDFARNGGDATLKSYEGYSKVLSEHVEWMEQLPYFLEFPEIVNSEGRHLLVSHSSVSHVWRWWKEDLIEQRDFEDHLLWNRHDVQDVAGVYNIFGHTPQAKVTPKSFCLNVDTGAYLKKREHFGVMSAYQFPEGIIYQQENIEE